MPTITASEALQSLLEPLKERVEIRAVNGDLIGIFTPRIDAGAYERVKQLFDREEIARRRATENAGYTIDEVMQHLRSLETNG
jgi:hypothetical protein